MYPSSSTDEDQQQPADHIPRQGFDQQPPSAYFTNGIQQQSFRNPSIINEADHVSPLIDDGGRRQRREHSNYVQKVTVVLAVLMFTMMIIIIAVASATFDKINKNIVVYVPSTTTVYPSIGLPGFEQLSWSDVVKEVTSVAGGSTVNFYTCGTCGKYNKWIDNYLKPQLKSLYNINMIRHPLASTEDAVLQVEADVAAGLGPNNGSVDIIWINLENFARLKNAGNAYGPWVTKVPSGDNFNWDDPSIVYDGGLPIGGCEFPYDGAQVVFIYNANQITSSTDLNNIKTIVGIEAWLKAHPGKFTYAAPAKLSADKTTVVEGDYTGSVFVRHVFYALAGPYTDFLATQAVNLPLYNARAPAAFQFLRNIQPYLYQNASHTHYYPPNNTVVDALFGAGKTFLTLSYTVSYAAGQVKAGVWNQTAVAPQGYVLTSGTIANTNYLAIPANARNKLAAVVAINFAATPASMYSRKVSIGNPQVYNPNSDAFTTGGWQVPFNLLASAPSTPSTATLAAARLGELSAAYIDKIEQDWYYCVLTYSGPNSAFPQCG